MKKGTKIALGVLTGGVALAIGAVVKLVRDKMSANNNDETAEAESYDEVDTPEEIEDSETSEETAEEE